MAIKLVERARDFIWRNARLIDRFGFAYHFEGGDKKAVIAALRAYRNPDGGFGNALEPDKRDPASQPVDVQVALEILDAVDGFDDPMALGVCDFLQGVSTAEGGVPSALPSLNAYPHAPWWTVGEPDPPAALNPTAAIVGLLLKHGVRHPWVDRAAAYCGTAIAASESVAFHDLMPMIAFLRHTPDRSGAERELDRVLRRIAAPGVVELDVDATGYVHRPLDWAPFPDHPCRALFSDAVIDRHLDALEARQQPDGGWPIAWPPISPAVELEWRGVVTIGALRTLEAYGR